eukprot:scpid48671/ scgid15850/ Transmembrane protein 43; Protein LUMA
MHRSSAMTGPGGSGWSHGGDRVTHVSYHRKPGFFQKAGDSLCGAVFGFILLVAAVPVLFLNEGRAVQTAQSLDEGLANCVSLRYGSPPFESNEQRLIHISGELSSRMPLEDTQFGVSMTAFRLERRVEMLQWVESQETREYEDRGETRRETTYSYNRDWRSDLVRSDSFEESLRHRNPAMFPISSSTFESPVVNVGEFSLSNGLLSKLRTESTIQPQSVARLRLGPGQKIWDSYVVQAVDPYNFQVGDVRIRWVYMGCTQDTGGQAMSGQLCVPQQVSIVGRQVGSTIGAYQTNAGDVLWLLYEGTMSAKAIFDAEHSSNNAWTWVLRLLGFFMMFIGLSLITSIVTAITSYIPFLGALVSFGVFLLNISLAMSLSLLVIAIGWLRYRPVLAMTLLAIGMMPYLVANLKSKPKSED